MVAWEGESFENITSSGMFEITEAGPLSVPIRAFSFKRDEDLMVTLRTQAEQNATSAAPIYPPGTVRFNTDAVALSNRAGMKIVAQGVDRRNYSRSISGNPALGELKEEWSVHQLEGMIRDDKEPSYVIDWLTNVGSAYFWPDDSEETTEIGKTLKLSVSTDGP